MNKFECNNSQGKHTSKYKDRIIISSSTTTIIMLT